MIQAKPHLKELYRTVHDSIDRKNYLRLDMNESVTGLPNDFIQKVLSNVNGEMLSTYPNYSNLVKKLSLHNGIAPEQLCVSNGSCAAIKYIFDAFVSSGDKVLLTDPTFAMYPVYCKMFEAEIVNAEYDEHFCFPFENFIKKIDKTIKMAVIVNPHNPTGSIIEPDYLLAVMKRTGKNDVLLVIDEAYYYYYPKTAISEINEYDNIIILRTFSKLCGIAALRLGYAAAQKDIIDNLKKVKPSFDTNCVAALFTEKLLEENALIGDLVDIVNLGRTFICQCLEEEGIEYKKGHANFILIKCGEKKELIIEGLKKKSILVADGFLQGYLKDYIRVTLGSKEIMKLFFDEFLQLWKLG
ncbi:MAG: histidinol-phosphate transaminase [Vulcanimicrobiota bacterium]